MRGYGGAVYAQGRDDDVDDRDEWDESDGDVVQYPALPVVLLLVDVHVADHQDGNADKDL